MTWIMLQSLFLPLSVVLMMSLYKSRRRFMTRFYEAMARNGKARKLYVQLLLVLLLLFHYAYANGHPGEFGIVLSTIICAAMFSTKRCNLQIFLCLFLEKLNMPQNTPVTKAS